MAKLSRPPPSSSRSRKTIFSSSAESEPESNNDSNSDSEFPDIAALSPSPKKKRKVSSPFPATKKRLTPPTDTVSTNGNQTVVESATSPNAASSSVAGIKRRKLLLGAVSDNVLFRKWTPAQEEEEDGVPARKKRGLTANKEYGLGLGMMRDDEKEGSDSEAETLIVSRKKVKEVKRVGESTVAARTVMGTTKSLFSDQNLSKKHREAKELVRTKNKKEKPSASLAQPPEQVASKSKDMMEIDQERDVDIFEDLEDFTEESFHTARSKEFSESNELGSEILVEKAPNANTASNSKDDDSDEDLDAFFSKLSNKPKIPAVRESHLSPTKPRSTQNSRGKRLDTIWVRQSRTLFDAEESDGRQGRAAKQAASSDDDTCGEEDVTQDFSCLQLESSSSSDPESSETETERRSRPPAATTTMKKRTQTPSPPPKIPKLKPKTSSATLPPSPPKKLPRIPSTPHRPSSDLFWSREFVDDWNDEHSPKKKEQPLFSLTQLASEATSTTSSNSPKKKPAARAPPSPQKAAALLAREARLARQLFDTHKHNLATNFLALLDARLTSSRLSALTASTGGIKLVWSKTLNTTAGRANWKKKSVTTRQGQGSKPDGSSKEAVVRQHASIELATKVLSTPERLFNTLAHEFCHLAVFMIDGVTTRPHGAEFKAWAKKVNESEFGRVGGGGRHRGVGKLNIRDGEDGSGGKAVVEWEGGYAVEVTTRHGYEIEFRYVWVCEGSVPDDGDEKKKEGKNGCGTEYKRHSKSIDPKRHRCGLCKGVLRQIKPAPRGQGQQHQQGGGGHISDLTGVDGNGRQNGMGMKEKGKMSEYQVFVKCQMRVVKAQKPGLAFGEVMKEVAERWKVEKARREKNKPTDTPPAETTGKLSTVLEEVVADEDGDGEDSADVFEGEPMVDVVDLTADD